uniref:Matrilin 2 n=1 Tax=Neogobius melanostomus TaxID=47308 RepID=A0A8C6TXE9_9GOBI
MFFFSMLQIWKDVGFYLISTAQCKMMPLDFVFVIDSSRSIRTSDYEKVKTFIINLLRFLNVGPNATRVGLLQYGSVVQNEFTVMSMKHLATGTMTGLALQYTMETAFTEEEGARPEELLIPRIAMVVTDGRPQDEVEEVAAQARQAGIQIFAIGVGRVDMNTLKAIGSEPHSEHVHLVANFSQIETLITVFQSKLCAEDTCAEVEHGCQHICANIPKESYICKCGRGYVLNPDKHTCRKVDHCADGRHGCEQEFENTNKACVCKCKKGFTLRPDGKTCHSLDLCQTVDHGCEHLCVNANDSYVCKCFEGFTLAEDRKSCKKPDCNSSVLDVVIVIDGSKSLGPSNFELVKQFVNTIVDAFDVSRTGTHIGLIQYSTKVRSEFSLNQFISARDVKQAVSQVQYMGRGSLTGSALRHMFETSFSPGEGARAGVQRVSIVFTDGRSQDDVSEWATKAKESGVTIYALGVGKAVEQELKEMASEPKEKHLFYTEDFGKMGEITEKLKDTLRICKGTSLNNMCLYFSLTCSLEALSKKIQLLENQNIRK